MLERLTMAPPDPILGLNETFRNDPNPEKINLSVGVYVDDTGISPIFSAVREAEKIILKSEKTKSYLGIGGTTEFGCHVRELILGAEHPVIQEERGQTAQTPGGTGALRVAGDFLKHSFPESRLRVSSPTWANHANVFQASSLEIRAYPYYDPKSHMLRFDEMLDVLGNDTKPGDILLLHGCCHNPTGVDLTVDQWEQLIRVMQSCKLLPLVDLAYQGFGRGLEEDVAGVRRMCSRMDELLICTSYSKNFGLYNDRVGALTVIGKTSKDAVRSFSHVKKMIRSNYSNPPAHGGLIVTRILEKEVLKNMWKEQLDRIRKRIQEMRRMFSMSMKERDCSRDFSFMTEESGMFSISGLEPPQIVEMREKHSIYIVGSGRINVAGMSSSNMSRLADAVISCL